MQALVQNELYKVMDLVPFLLEKPFNLTQSSTYILSPVHVLHLTQLRYTQQPKLTTVN